MPVVSDAGLHQSTANDGTRVTTAPSYMQNAHAFNVYDWDRMTPRARPVNWGSYLPITEWLNGVVNYDAAISSPSGHSIGGTSRSLTVGNGVQRFGITATTPEIGLLCDILNGARTATGTDGEGVIWFDAMDAAHKDFGAKLFRVLLMNVYHWKLDFDPFMPSFAALNHDVYSVITAPASKTMSSPFPEWRRSVTSDSGLNVLTNGTYNFVPQGVPVLPLLTSSDPLQPISWTPSNLKDPASHPLAVNDSAYQNFDVTNSEKGLQIPIYMDDAGKICVNMDLVQKHGVRVSESHFYARMSFAHARQADDFGDYGVISMPMSLDNILRTPYQPNAPGDPGLLNNRLPRRYRASVQRTTRLSNGVRDDSDIVGSTFDAIPLCSLLCGHEKNSNNSDAITIQDITLSGHIAGFSTLAYTKAKRTSANTANQVIRNGVSALHVVDLRDGVPFSQFTGDSTLSTGIFPTLPQNTYVTTSITVRGDDYDVLFGQSNVQTNALELYVDETGPQNEYVVNGINAATDNALTINTDELEAVLDTGYFFLGGRVNRFGDARWTIQ